MTIKTFIGDKAFYRRILAITIPILIQNVITNFVSLIDNIMVGQIGTEQMSGVAIVNELVWVFNICIFGGISCAGIFTAQYFGKGDTEGVRNTFRAKIIIVSLMSVIAILLFALFPTELISLFLHESQEGLDIAKTLEYGKQYIAIMLIQIIPFAIMQTYAGTLRETGESFVPMISGVCAVVVNVLLNYVLIFGKLGIPALGIVGAAIATVIARFTEFFIVVFWTHRNSLKNKFIIGAYKTLAIPKDLVLGIIKRGTPLMLNEMLWALGMASLMQCYSIRGLEVVSALNISQTVSNLFNCSFIAFGTAISIIIGQHLGAGNLKKAKEDDTRLLAIVVVLCIIIGAIMAVFAPIIPEIYNTTDTVKALACDFLIIAAVLMPVNGFVHSAYFTLRSGGKTLITLLFDSVFMWCVSMSSAYILSRYTAVPIVPLYAIIQGIEIIKCVIGYILVKKGVWLNNLVGKNAE